MRNITEGVAVWQEAVTIPTYPVGQQAGRFRRCGYLSLPQHPGANVLHGVSFGLRLHRRLRPRQEGRHSPCGRPPCGAGEKAVDLGVRRFRSGLGPEPDRRGRPLYRAKAFWNHRHCRWFSFYKRRTCFSEWGSRSVFSENEENGGRQRQSRRRQIGFGNPLPLKQADDDGKDDDAAGNHGILDRGRAGFQRQ